MKRVGAHYLYISPEIQLKRGVVEIDNEGIVADFFSLDNVDIETSHTEFYTGILAPSFVSLTDYKHLIPADFSYFDNNNFHIIPSEKKEKMILDFGNADINEISSQLFEIQQKMKDADIFDFINWSSYLPRKILGKQAVSKGEKTPIWLFENIDIINKKFLSETKITAP